MQINIEQAFEAEVRSEALHRLLNEKIGTIAKVGDFALMSLEGRPLNFEETEVAISERAQNILDEYAPDNVRRLLGSAG